MCKAVNALGGSGGQPGCPQLWHRMNLGRDWAGGMMGLLPAMSPYPGIQLLGEPMVLLCPLGCPRAAR